MRSPVNHVLPLILIAALAGGAGAQARNAQPPGQPANGPAADYPVVVGAPFQVGDTTWTPEDKLNYDAFGYALIGSDGDEGVSAAHKTLPLPSYVEVTSLDSGRTILVRVEHRGPMNNDRLIQLSPGAAAQLGFAGNDKPAVRVRRVNPPEQERAMLRSGGRAPERMKTPKGLLDALNRKLAANKPAPKAVPSSAPVNSTPTPVAVASPKPVPTRPPKTARGTLVVQIAAFSTQERASGVAVRLGGQVTTAGRFWRVRLGPFATRAEAEAALAKARAAGYSDARIQRAG